LLEETVYSLTTITSYYLPKKLKRGLYDGTEPEPLDLPKSSVNLPVFSKTLLLEKQLTSVVYNNPQGDL